MLTLDQQHAIIGGILDREGGFTANPHDSGGVTKWGISQRAYPTVDIAALTRADATAMYLRDYMQKYKLHELSHVQNAEIVCDWLVNSGPIAIKPLQRLLRVTPDGIIGAKTLHALNMADPQMLLNARLDYYIRLVNHPFLQGWVNRLRKLGL